MNTRKPLRSRTGKLPVAPDAGPDGTPVVPQDEQQLRLFIESAPAAIAMFDHRMRYLAVSGR